jgi:hypothetical protein
MIPAPAFAPKDSVNYIIVGNGELFLNLLLKECKEIV